ncbi:MAG TPA: hypothetical protein VET90_07890, partial [Candidatus Binatus sp.]|nr:hypothetical protein [Candidatus Binatus sp.]
MACLLGLGLIVSLGGPGASVTRAASPTLSPHIVASFPFEDPYGRFAESMAIDPAGNLYVAVTRWRDEPWNVGQVWRIGRNGAMTTFGAGMDACILTGLAFGPDGDLYAGFVSCDIDGVASGVLRINPKGPATRVLTLPPGTFPNGLAFHGPNLYVSESYGGAIWRFQPHDGNQTPAQPWLQSDMLAPTWSLGVDGLAFHGNQLYAGNYNTGALITIPLRRNRSAATPTKVVQDPALI